MYDVITVGSGTIDVFIWTESADMFRRKKQKEICFPIGSKILIKKLNVDTGGGGTNTAVALARLGLKTAWLGKLGNDKNGKRVLERVRSEGVDFIGTYDGEMTGQSIIIDSRLEKDRTILAYKGVNDKLRFEKIGLGKLRAKWFYLCAMEGESLKTLFKLADFAKRNKIRVIFNPSSYLAKQGMAFLKRIVDKCDILVLNKEEAQYLVGSGDINALLKKLQRHVKLAVITDGPNGAFAYNGIYKYSIRPRKVRVVETTGAGDAFASSFLAGIILKRDVEYALQLGQANAESKIQHVGAKNGLLKAHEANEILRMHPVKVRKEKI